MSRFGTDINMEDADFGAYRGYLREVACKCWFSRSGELLPLAIQYEDEDGERHIGKVLRIKQGLSRNYAGTQTVEFDCTVSVCQTVRELRLTYFKQSCKWAVRE